MANKNSNLDNQSMKGTAFIEKLSHDGRGIANIQQVTTFIAGSLPTETVTYKIKHKSSHYHEAEAIDILKSAPERIQPICPHFRICGGCGLQHMNDDMQLSLKENTLLEQLKHFGKVVPERVLPPLQSTSSHYRHKARLGVKFVIKKDKMLVGFREKSSHYLADLDTCPILHTRLSEQLINLKQLVRSLSIYQFIPQIEIAVGDTTVALIFRHLRPFTVDDLSALSSFGRTNDFHIYLQPTAPLTLSKLWPQDNNLYLTYSLPAQQLTFSFHPLDFTQVNLEMNRKMVNQSLNLLELLPTDHVLDLFCGIGNFTLPIALHCEKVTGVEGGKEMVARAQKNAINNQLLNVVFHADNLQQSNTISEWFNKKYDKLLLDPPRTGAKEILPYIQKWSPKKIVYVSCNPATLARDAYELVHQHHYVLKSAGIMNMFPHTSHVEAMAVFDKKK